MPEQLTDQAYINNLCQDFQNAVDTLAARQPLCANITSLQQASEDARTTHHDRRADEALACAVSRGCEEQLIQKWREVVQEQEKMREILGHIP